MNRLQVLENDLSKCYNEFATVTFGGALCFYQRAVYLYASPVTVASTGNTQVGGFLIWRSS